MKVDHNKGSPLVFYQMISCDLKLYIIDYLFSAKKSFVYGITCFLPLLSRISATAKSKVVSVTDTR